MDDTTLTIIFNLVLWAFFFYCGYKYHEYIVINEIVEMVTKMTVKLHNKEGVEVDPEVTNMTGEMYQLRHEEHDGVHFFYYEDDDGFACQGKTLEEAATNFKEVTKGDGMAFFKLSNKDEEYVFANGEVLHAAIQKITV